MTNELDGNAQRKGQWFYNLICYLRGHKDERFLVDGDGTQLSSGCFIRVRICKRCKRWEFMTREERRIYTRIVW